MEYWKYESKNSWNILPENLIFPTNCKAAWKYSILTRQKSQKVGAFGWIWRLWIKNMNKIVLWALVQTPNVALCWSVKYSLFISFMFKIVNFARLCPKIHRKLILIRLNLCYMPSVYFLKCWILGCWRMFKR